MMPPVFCSGPHPPAASQLHTLHTLNMQGGKDGATANIPGQDASDWRCTSADWLLPLPLPALLPVPDRENGGFHAVRDDFCAANRQTVSHRADVLTVQGFSTTSSKSFSAVPSPSRLGQSAPPLQVLDWLHWHPPPDRRRFGHEIHKLRLAPLKAPQRLQAHAGVTLHRFPSQPQRAVQRHYQQASPSGVSRCNWQRAGPDRSLA